MALSLAAIETVGIALTYHNIISLLLTGNYRRRSTSEGEFPPPCFQLNSLARVGKLNATLPTLRHPPATKTPPAAKPARRQPFKQAAPQERSPSRSRNRQAKRSPKRNRSRTPPSRKANPPRRRQDRQPSRPTWVPPPSLTLHVTFSLRGAL